MTSFKDGPAAGKSLLLKRSPQFLRVVEADGEFDALDLIEDRPRPRETCYAYELVEARGMMHLNMRDRKGKRCCGWYAVADYRLVEPQPEQAVMCDTAKWQAWALAEAEARAAKQPAGAK